MPERERYNGVLEKAIAILHVFSCEEPSLSPRAIAARTHLPLPTIYRLAHALSQHGLLEQEGQQFRPGVTLVRLGWPVAEGNDLRRRSLPYLHWLNEQTQENAELHIRQAETHIAIAVLPGTQRLRFATLPGEPLPLHGGAVGNVLLAWLPAGEREALAVRSAARFDGLCCGKSADVQAAWERVRLQGWSLSEHEPEGGIVTIAAPIVNVAGGVEGAIALVAATGREAQCWPSLVCEAAAHVSHVQGQQRNERQSVSVQEG